LGSYLVVRVGFTGTSRHVTPAAVERLREELRALGPGELHHGDCVEADAAAHDTAEALGWAIVVHPPSNARLRAFKAGPRVMVREPRPYLERNRDVVEETSRLIACPEGFEEVRRSGTWATVRYARDRGRPVLIIWPDGSVQGWSSPSEQLSLLSST
jgi:hypothetical protein